MEGMFKVTLEDEFKKNPELKAEDIENIQTWIKTQPHLPSPIPDLFVVLALQACQWDLEEAKKTIDNYYTLKTEFTEFFTDRDPTSQEEAASYPVKACHYINAHSFLEKCFTLMKPLFRSKVYEMFHMHSNMESLYKVIPKEIVPKDYGGDELPLEQLNEMNLQKLEDYRQYFKDEQTMRVDESKRVGKQAKSDLVDWTKGWWLTAFKKLSFK